jgi:hypothetical protein
MNQNDFVSVNHILAEVTSIVDDVELKSGFSTGWYTSRIQDALQELSFDTFFDKKTLDYEFPKESLALEIPKDIFNIREIYVYSGGCCTPQTSQRVYWKRQYNNNGKGEGYTSMIVDRENQANSDPFLPHTSRYSYGSFAWDGVKYYANIQNGLMMFSSSCSSFHRVRIVANGMGGEVGDMPIIPRFFERAINDYVKLKFYDAMKAREPRKYRVLWSDAYQELYDNQNGSWNKARKRISSMDTWEKESLEEYISSMYHK